MGEVAGWQGFRVRDNPLPCREKGEELRAAVEEWQTKRAVPEPRLTTGFLDGIQPIVDSYELKVLLTFFGLLHSNQPIKPRDDLWASVVAAVMSQ